MINKFSLFFLLVALTACSSKSVSNSSSGSDPYASAKGSSTLRPYTVEFLANGLQVIKIESHSLPSVSYGLLVKGGSTIDPMAKSGLTNLTASLMMKGTATRSANKITDELGNLGSEFEIQTTEDFSWFQVSGLSNHQSALFDIFSDVILHPKFSSDELEREKKLILASIEQRVDHPSSFADLAFDAYLFGAHPYAKPSYGTVIDITSLQTKDLATHYSQQVRPNNSILVITGDLTPETVSAIRRKFESWPKGETRSRNFSVMPEITGVNIRLVNKPDLTQSQIIMGHLGIKRNDPDFLPLEVATLVLGGNFYSRLMEQVRVKLGLTYDISSSFEPRLDRGAFIISTFTKNQSVGAAITESLKVFKDLYENGVKRDEVEAAKNYLKGNFPRSVETSERLGFSLALLNFYGVSDDYLKHFTQNITDISVSDVNAAIKKHMNPNDLKILVLSKASEVAPQLKSLGLLEIKKFDEIF
jgi:zinc protease